MLMLAIHGGMRKAGIAALAALTLAASHRVPMAAGQTHPTRLGLFAVRIPEAVESGAKAEIFLDSLIGARLASSGYTVVPPDSLEPLWVAAVDSAGPAYDPVTGEKDTTRMTAARGHFLRTATERFAVDFVVVPYVGPVSVKFHGGTAKWDGVSEKTGARGGFGGEFLGTHEGHIPALTLDVEVLDLRDSVVYQGSGGIQLLAKVVDGQLQNVNGSMLLTDFAILTESVRLALEKFGKKIPKAVK